ncbi:DUF998 domain-containing protein [Flavobacteriaceae bacterium TP-CH-4]|uniref:DUF998 domain-containing protein n=1 Tax=Pelagihabitans pacificus TaxID=2696054 RepID=A0A967AQF0_9FLAO|nr:DUF998 domain-containing protein [Pelagihabitans pacificus]NHF58454.1 DUF998 domain-containing protein [Pelagihabitans pacificus]
MIKKVTFVFGLSGAFIFAVASVFGGLQIEGYSQLEQYISESYATGMPNAAYLQYAFIISGMLLAFFGFLSARVYVKSKSVKIAFVLFAIFYGLGTIITGIFPCDIGCVPNGESPSLSQFVHNLSGTLTYSTVPFCMLAVGFGLRKEVSYRYMSRFSLGAGVVALTFVVFLFGDANGPFKGIYQRIIEASVLSWVCVVSFFAR